jgi:hypothetical protein
LTFSTAMKSRWAAARANGNGHASGAISFDQFADPLRQRFDGCESDAEKLVYMAHLISFAESGEPHK